MMIRMKKLLSAVLAGLMLLSVMASIPVTATAQTTAEALADNLLIHYDFEGDTAEEALKDKANGAANKKQNDLTVYSNGSGTIDSFTFENGIVTSNSADALLVSKHTSGGTDDMWVNTTESVTWFVRYCVNSDYNFTAGDAYVFEMGHTPSDYTLRRNSMYLDLRKATGATRWSGWNVDCPKNSEFYYNDITTNLWKNFSWVNVAITRTYNATTNQYDFVLKAYNDDLVQIAMDTHSDEVLATNACPELSFFGYYSENRAVSAANLANSFANGLSIDDFRLYNVALSDAQVKNLIDSELVDHSYANKLLVHYTFEGETPEAALKDKATGTANTVSDDLAVFTTANGTLADFTFSDGIVTSNSTNALLLADAGGASADFGQVSKNTKTSATWFVRYQMEGVHKTLTGSNDGYIFDFCKQAGEGARNSMYVDMRADNSTIHWQGWQGSYSTANNLWKDAGWMNLAITRSYDEANSQYVFVLRAYNDEAVLVQEVVYNHSEEVKGDNNNTTLALFGSYNENNKSISFGYAPGLSIDDFRIYSTVLTQDEIKEVVGSLQTQDALAPVINVGAQKALDGSKVRLVAEINGYDYKAAGFYVTATWTGKNEADEVDLPCNFAYTSLLAEEENGNINEITPANDGYYLIAVVIDNIPDKDGLTLTFTPYTVSTDGTITLTGEEMVYDHTTGISSK